MKKYLSVEVTAKYNKKPNEVHIYPYYYYTDGNIEEKKEFLGNLYREMHEKVMESDLVGGGTVLSVDVKEISEFEYKRESLKEENKFKEAVKKANQQYH